MRAAAGRGQRRGLGLRRRHDPRQERQAHRQRAARRTSSPRSPRCRASRASRVKTGRRPQNADEAAIDVGDRRQGGVEGRRQGHAPWRPRRASATRSSATTQIAGLELVRRRRRARPRPARGPADARQGRRLRRDPGRRQARRVAAAARRRSCARALGPTVDVRTGQEQARQGVQGHPRQPRVPEDLPARLRLHLAVRRRLPHLQHLLDHRRPAHARVRAAAHPRRVAPPDLAGGRQRGARCWASSAASSASCWASGRPRSCARCSRRSAPTCRARASSSRAAR